MTGVSGKSIPKGKRERKKLLLLAVRSKNESLIDELIEADASLLNSSNAHGNDTPLIAALETDLEIAEKLISMGADPNQRNHGGYSLMDGAMYDGDRKRAEFLIGHGVSYDCHHAAGLNDAEALKKMLKEDKSAISKLKKSRHPLQFAAHTDASDTAEILIDSGADIHYKDKEGFTALQFAAKSGAENVARLLLEAGASPNEPGTYSGGTVLHRAVTDGHAKVAELLLEHGADPNKRDNLGKTALHHAVSKNARMVEVVCKFNPNKTIKNIDGLTPVDLAKKKNNKKILALLNS